MYSFARSSSGIHTILLNYVGEFLPQSRLLPRPTHHSFLCGSSIVGRDTIQQQKVGRSNSEGDSIGEGMGVVSNQVGGAIRNSVIIPHCRRGKEREVRNRKKFPPLFYNARRSFAPVPDSFFEPQIPSAAEKRWRRKSENYFSHGCDTPLPGDKKALKSMTVKTKSFQDLRLSQADLSGARCIAYEKFEEKPHPPLLSDPSRSSCATRSPQFGGGSGDMSLFMSPRLIYRLIF